MGVLKIQGKFILLCTIICLSLVFGQNQLQDLRNSRQDYPRSGERYITDQHGVIRMWVNVWGHVARPGSYLVYDGIDLPALLSVTGGPKSGANMNSIKLYRGEPDSLGHLSYTLNMKNFLSTGDKNDFVPVLPNDTYIIKQTMTNYVLSNISIINSIMSAVNLYYLALLRSQQTK